MWTYCAEALWLTRAGLTGTAGFLQSQSSVPKVVHKRCISGTCSPNSGWRDGKSFSACQRTGLERTVAEEIYHATGRERLPGNLLLDGSWEGGG